MIVSLLSLVYSAVGIDVSRTVFRYFISHTRTIVSSGLWNYHNTYCFRFSLNFLHWSLYYLGSAVVPKTITKSSNSPLRFQSDEFYFWRLKRPPCSPHPWWTLLPPQLTLPRNQPPLIVLDFLVVLWPPVVVASPSPPLLPTADESASISGVMNFSF